MVPDTGCLSVVSSVVTVEAVTSGPGGPAIVGRGRGRLSRARARLNEARLTGRLPLGGSWDGALAVADPANWRGAAFRGVLETKGIRVTGGVATSREDVPAGARVLAAHDSPPLADMVRVVNKKSQNLPTPRRSCASSASR